MVHSGGANAELEFVRVTPAGSGISLPTATRPCHSSDNRQPGSCPGLQPRRGAKTAGIIGNTVQVNSGFPHPKEYLRSLSQIWARALKNIRQPCVDRKKFQEYRFEGVPDY